MNIIMNKIRENSSLLSFAVYLILTLGSFAIGYGKFRASLDEILVKQTEFKSEKQEFNIEIVNLRLAIVELKGEIKELRVIQQMHINEEHRDR